ncbi:hypothetical protein IPG41_04325 [Candidatus Peregrinibacteria bacterium]|nr:MAG: hypothetical protein IPG41_04325 [Candidatus Peregrinibacteria bacterium]
MRHALVIYNPVSGSKKWRDVPATLRKVLLQENYSHTWFETQPVKRQNFSALGSQKYDRIIACGGDGTIAEVVTWMIQNKLKTPLVVLSLGSANLLARSLGLPFLNIKKALQEGLTAPGKPLDVMRINGKHIALIAAGRGYDAFLMQHTQRTAKRRWGLLAYLGTFLKTFLFYRNKPYKLTVDGQRFYITAKSIMVINVAPLPQMLISGQDGMLNLFALGRFNRLRSWKGKKISIKTPNELTFQLDGEVFKSKTLNIEVLPGAIQVVYKKFLFQI